MEQKAESLASNREPCGRRHSRARPRKNRSFPSDTPERALRFPVWNLFSFRLPQDLRFSFCVVRGAIGVPVGEWNRGLRACFPTGNHVGGALQESRPRKKQFLSFRYAAVGLQVPGCLLFQLSFSETARSAAVLERMRECSRLCRNRTEGPFRLPSHRNRPVSESEKSDGPLPFDTIIWYTGRG